MQDYYAIWFGLYLAIFSCFRNTVFVLLLYCPSLYVIPFYCSVYTFACTTYGSVAIAIEYIFVYSALKYTLDGIGGA